MKQYPKYKDSGIQWIGRIPSSWKITKTKYIAKLYTGNSLDDAQKEKYTTHPLEMDVSDIPYIATKDITSDCDCVSYYNGVAIPNNEQGFKKAPEGSFLLCIEGGSAGKKHAFLEREVCFVNKLCCFDTQLNSRFHYYFIQSNPFTSHFQQLIQGLIGGVSVSELNNMEIVVPPVAEQEAIARYLDEKTAKIDESVYLLEQQKADLQEFRKALISQTVTRGLNPNAKLKDSGIQWMGGVPAEWRIAPLKTLLSLLTDGTHQTPTYLDKGIPFVSIKDMSSGKLNFSDAKYISQEEHELLSKHAPVAKGDILFSRIGTLGVFIKVDTDEVFDIFVSLGLMKIIPDAINTDFLVYYLSSDTIRKYIDIVKAGEGTSAAKFNLTDVSKTPILLPSQAEQQAIVDYLDTKTAKINETIARIDTQIADLKAYRTALITEAVTGKMDVRLEN